MRRRAQEEEEETQEGGRRRVGAAEQAESDPATAAVAAQKASTGRSRRSLAQRLSGPKTLQSSNPLPFRRGVHARLSPAARPSRERAASARRAAAQVGRQQAAGRWASCGNTRKSTRTSENDATWARACGCAARRRRRPGARPRCAAAVVVGEGGGGGAQAPRVPSRAARAGRLRLHHQLGRTAAVSG